MDTSDKRILGIITAVILMVMITTLVVLRSQAIDQRERIQPADPTARPDVLLGSG